MVCPAPMIVTSGVFPTKRSGAALSVSVSAAGACVGVGRPVVSEPSSARAALLTMLARPAAAGLRTVTLKVAEPLPPPPARLPTVIVQVVPAGELSAQLHEELPVAT